MLLWEYNVSAGRVNSFRNSMLSKSDLNANITDEDAKLLIKESEDDIC